MGTIETFFIFITFAAVVHGLANPAHSVFIKRALPLSPHGPSDPNSSEEETGASVAVPVSAPQVQPLPLRVESSEISPTSTAADVPEATTDNKKRQVSYFPPTIDGNDEVEEDHFPAVRLRQPYPSSCKAGDCTVIKKVPTFKKHHHKSKHSEPCNYILVEKRMYSCEPDDAVMQLLRKADGAIVGSLSPDGRIGMDPTKDLEDS